MLIENLEINLDDIKDEQIREAIRTLFNTVEDLFQENTKLKKENQNLKDEINLLKGEQGKPDIKPKNNGGGNVSSEKERKGYSEKKKRVLKEEIVKVDRKEKCRVDPNILPKDAMFKGYENIVIQDIQIITNNVEFQREVYYSPSKKCRYIADLPKGYEGKFGPQIKSLALLMKHACNMSEPKILEFMKNFGISISKSTLSRMLIKDKEAFHQEKSDIFEAGIKSSNYQQTDDTGARVNGENYHTHIFCNNFFTAFFTREKKDRLTLLEILQGKEKLLYCLNTKAFQLMEKMKVPTKIRKNLSPFQDEKMLEKDQIEKLINVSHFKIGTQQRKRILEATAIAAYHKGTNLPIVNILICDDAPQFKLITNNLGLCWIHDGRHYKKINPLISYHKKLQNAFLEKYWNFYQRLLLYKQKPSKEFAEYLSKEFDVLFSEKTGYQDLDDRIMKTKDKKEELLLVLAFPEIPLHNNAAELGARVQVRKRDVSLHTMTQEGTDAVDTFLSIIETAKKLGVNAYDYLFDRISKNYELPSLADLIYQRARENKGFP